MPEEREPYTVREDELVKEKSVDRNRFLAMAIIMLVSFGGLVSFDIVYNSYRQRQADQRFCALFVGLDDNYRAAPTTGPGRIPERSRPFVKIVHDLRQDLNCPETPEPSPIPLQAPTGTPSPAGTR